MYERRVHEIKSKIFKPDDIRRIAKLFEVIAIEFVGKISEKDRMCDLSFSIESVDDATYSSNSIEIFQQEGLIDTKNIKRIHMSFQSYKPRATVEIHICDSRYGFGNSIEVSGLDSTWVSGIYSKLLDSLNSCQLQNSLGTKYKWPLSILSTILIGLSFVGIANLILNFTSESGIKISYWVAFSALGLSVIMSVPIEKMWPNVEIISGNNKLQASSMIKGIFYVILVPLIVAIIANLVSKLLI
jgi:hypothetical protein